MTTELQIAKENFEKIKTKLDELKNKMYMHQRMKFSLIDEIKAEMNENIDIDKITKLKTKREAAADIVKELKDKVDYIEKYDYKKAEDQVKYIKAKAVHYENQINNNLILIEIKQKDLEKIEFEANRTRAIIEKRKKTIGDLREQFPNITDRDIDLLEGHRLQKAVVKALNEKLTGRQIDKKFGF